MQYLYFQDMTFMLLGFCLFFSFVCLLACFLILRLIQYFILVSQILLVSAMMSEMLLQLSNPKAEFQIEVFSKHGAKHMHVCTFYPQDFFPTRLFLGLIFDLLLSATRSSLCRERTSLSIGSGEMLDTWAWSLTLSCHICLLLGPEG